MSITDELRKWGYGFCGDTHDVVTAIADRIDAEHERLMQEQPFTVDMVPMTDERMSEHGWVRLPKDADGEYIHIGDRMENNERVARIVLTDDSWEPSVYLEKLPNVLHEYFCHEISHYHAPTVEDVLREMHAKLDEVTALYVGEAIDSDERDSDEARIFAEYAAKLREMLAGDAE